MASELTVNESLEALPRGGTSRFTPRRCRPRAREWGSARWGWLGLGGLLASGLLIALAAGRTSVLLPASVVRPVPDWLAGVFGQGVVDLGLGGLIAVLSVMFVSYALTIGAASQLSARPVLIGIAVLNAVVLLAPPLFSTDVFSYVAYGRIGALYGTNPYLHGPTLIQWDPLYQFIALRWVNTPTAYGPLFTVLSYLLAPLGIAWNVVAYKAIAAISTLVIVVVVWNAARLRGLNSVKAAAVVGLNPVIVVYGVGGGHNDLLMLAILVTGVYVLLQEKQRTSGALIVAASAVKLTAGVLLPFAVAQSARRRAGSIGLRSVLLGLALSIGIASLLSFLVFGTGPLHLLGTLHQVQAHGGVNSFPGVILTVLGLGKLIGTVSLVLDAGLVVCILWLLVRVWRGQLDWISGAGWATVGMLLTAGLLLPWYVGWLVPLAALSTDRRLFTASLVLTGIGLTTL
jgi:Glycosyltransferase family 87